jgi:3',5'-cyclic AMP phosphodiesterase CpdA
VGRTIPGWAQDAASVLATAFNRTVFRSAPGGAPLERTPGSWSFAAIGDFGAGTRAQLDVARNVLAGPQQLVLTLGDTVYDSGLESEYVQHFDPPERFGRIRERFPVFPTVGNHDVRGGGVEPYHRRFPEAGGQRRYVFEREGVRFFSLDSTESLDPGTPQWAWLEQQLGQAWSGWKVLYMHHPLRSGLKGRDNPERAARMGELMARHGVDLVLVGHDHAYDRSRPLNDYGTIQVTAGNGGRMLYPYRSRQPEWSAHREVVHGHVDVEVTPDALVVRHVRRDGSVGDTHAIRTRSGVAVG